ncbi:MAG: class I SAM-dependent methyltransferase [Eubacterium sp.]|nr:class I SAM-dependent methyltransferase [Eubacterium sp.]
MKLSKRLEAVAGLVTKQGVLADVGCDHGFLPIALYEQGRIKKAIALDVNEGPLLRAREHICEAGLADVIETRLSDGLAALKDGEADSVVIAGMGGNLMQGILARCCDVAKSCKEIILQPQSEIDLLRAWLTEAGFKICAEDMVLEGGKYYPMMRVCFTGLEMKLTKVELSYGPCLLRESHPVLLDFLKKEDIRVEHILDQLQKDSMRYEQRIRELKMDRELISKALEICR